MKQFTNDPKAQTLGDNVMRYAEINKMTIEEILTAITLIQVAVLTEVLGSPQAAFQSLAASVDKMAEDHRVLALRASVPDKLDS